MRRASSLAQRVGSAAVLLPIAIAVVWWSPWAVAAAVVALIVVSLLEIYGAAEHAGYRPQRWLGLAIGLAVATAIYAGRLTGSDLTTGTLAAVTMVGLAAALPQHARKGILADWALTLAGALYIGALAAHIALIRLIDTPLLPGPLRDAGLAPGAGWVYFVCAVTWLQDTLAYFVGKSYGRHRMTPTLSPKKTWEGAAGGMAGAILGGVLAILICGLPVSPWVGVLLGIVGGVIGPLGDLVESMIKRQAGLKDAGHLIPGHGGLLDRIDSFLFTAPALYYLILLMVR
jgi:phosphatidate cytidylyltransferase